MYEKKRMHPSNFELHILADCLPELQAAVQIAFEDDDTKVRIWKVENEWLVLREQDDGDKVSHSTAFAMNVSETVSFVWSWLKQHVPQHDSRDIDGSVEPGAFELHGGSMGEVLRVRKTWSEYHK